MVHTYDEVIAEIKRITGPNPTPQQMVDAENQLSDDDKAVLAANPQVPKLPSMSDDQIKSFKIGMAKTITSDEGEAQLRSIADDAVKAVNSAESMFYHLTAKLSAIDDQYLDKDTDPFCPRLQKIHDNFRTAVSKSQTIATEIAQYAQGFGDVVQAAGMNDIPVKDRLDAITEYIQQAKDFEKEAHKMTMTFDSVKDTFAALVGDFSTWAKEKEGQIDAQIADLTKQIEQLAVKIDSLHSALLGLAISTAGTVILTGVIAAFSGPFAGLVIAGGMVIAGLEVAGMVGVGIAIAVLNGQKSSLETQKTNLENEKQEIENARGNLETLAQGDLKTLGGNITAIDSIWKHAKSDAVLIQGWLKEGADFAKMPLMMELELKHAIKIYNTMANYLLAYANGLQS